MSSFFKLSYNPQAFRTSLVVTLSAFALDLLFFQLIIPSNIEGINVIVLSILYYLILFLIIQYSIEIYIKLYLERGVKKVLDELNEEILKDTYDEKDLEKLTLNLIQKARERTSEINVLKDQENYRREFLGNVSHELKTPIFNIQGYVHTLLDGAIKDDNVNIKYLQRTSQSIDRLIAIIDDLDAISRLESDELKLEKTNWDIIELINEVFETFEVKSEKKNVIWYPFSDRYREFDKQRNLYKNSLGNVFLIEEVNHTLKLTFHYSWHSSKEYGFIRKAYLYIKTIGRKIQYSNKRWKGYFSKN